MGAFAERIVHAPAEPSRAARSAQIVGSAAALLVAGVDDSCPGLRCWRSSGTFAVCFDQMATLFTSQI